MAGAAQPALERVDGYDGEDASQRVDEGLDERPLAPAVDDVGQVDAVRRQAVAHQRVELARRQVVGHRHVVEGVPLHHRVGAARRLRG